MSKNEQKIVIYILMEETSGSSFKLDSFEYGILQDEDNIKDLAIPGRVYKTML